MENLNVNNANTILERMILNTYYDNLGDIVSPKVEEVRMGNKEITVTYINGQKVRFSVELLNK